MENINYSIIIPHKNCPDLLQRCLDSIPRRNDLQIIIVDDNSDIDKVDFYNFPGLNDSFVEVYFTKEGKGAGYARNVGLKYAKGKWLLFADADDFFCANFENILDKYLQSDYDIIYFGVDSVYSDTLEKSKRGYNNNRLLKNAIKKKDLNLLRFRKVAPWAKMISYNIVNKNNIIFDETYVSNDVWFSIISGFYAHKIHADETFIYTLTYRRGSLENSTNIKNINERILIACKCNDFLRNKGLFQYRTNICAYIYMGIKLDFSCFSEYIWILLNHYKGNFCSLIVDLFSFIVMAFRK